MDADDLPDDLTIDETRRVVAELKRHIGRLTGENEGLFRHIELLETRNSQLVESLDARKEYLESECAFWDEWGDYLDSREERILQLEAEVVMLRRRRGTGIGRGRPADWTENQAKTVRDLKDGGMSYRRIADEVRLTPSQVWTILKPRVTPAVTRESRESRLAHRAIEVERFCAAVKQRKTAATRAAARKGR